MKVFFKKAILSEISGHCGARLVASGERSATNRPRQWGGVGRMLALPAVLVSWRISLRSPCATVDSQRTILHHHQNAATPNKEGKTKQNRKNKQHVRVRGFLLVFHDYCFQILVSFYSIQNRVISIAYCKKCLLYFVWQLFVSFALQRKPQDRGAWSEVVFLLLSVTNPLPYFWTLSEWWPQLAGRRGEDWGCPSVPFRQAPTQE